jgi:DNA-directed RNA polymerase specialized sigma24 family protein
MASHSRRGSGPAADRRLSLAEARFYAAVFGSARKGSLGELRRRGCGEEEAEEIFTAAFERVMETVDPIARGFTEAQMVSYVKRACWFRLIEERRRRGLRAEIGLGAILSLSDSSTPGPEELAEEREAVAIGREAVQMLSERDRSVFRQRHQMSLSPEEILQNTPGLSLRTYRKIIQRANARVLDAFERIQGGERCEEMRTSLLRRYVAEESPEAECRAIEAHLAHCRACRQTQAQMRSYLIDVAGSLLVASSPAKPPGEAATHLLQLGSHAAQMLGEVGRGALERVREALGRVALRLPGEDGSAGQVLGASSIKAASACAGLAGACLAAGVVPGVGGIGLSGHQGHGKAPPARSAPYVIRSSRRGTPIEPLAKPQAASPTQTEKSPSADEQAGKATRQVTQPSASTSQPVAPVSNLPSEARVSGRQTGIEVGAESGGQPLPASPTLAPSKPPSQPDSSGAAVRDEGSSSSRSQGSGSEFGM